jgi:hypothetical protein
MSTVGTKDRPAAMHFDHGIVGTAFLTRDGELLTLPRPARHCHFFGEYNADCRDNGWDFPWEGWSREKLKGSKQGFVTHEGKYVDRYEAARIALEAKQIWTLNWPPQLYSEDLW